MQILASIGQLEFFYDQAPMVMRSCSMALQLLSVCIGSYLSGALVYCVGRWCADVFGAAQNGTLGGKNGFKNICKPARQPLMMWSWLSRSVGVAGAKHGWLPVSCTLTCTCSPPCVVGFLAVIGACHMPSMVM
jgi:hypothetical protein